MSFKIYKIIKIIRFLLLFFSVYIFLYYYTNNYCYFYNNEWVNFIKFFKFPTNFISIFLINFLFFILIITIKFIKNFWGPLRLINSYFKNSLILFFNKFTSSKKYFLLLKFWLFTWNLLNFTDFNRIIFVNSLHPLFINGFP